jgi:prepilin-type N-terminal cleavage/methylation domain-containing protein
MKRSFTLIEILVVIVVVGILSALIIIGMGSIMMGARDAKRTTEITKLRNAIWSASNMGVSGYPLTPDQGSGARAWCHLGTSDSNCSEIEAVLGSSIPKDPLYSTGNKEWSYNYKSNGSTFDLYAKLEKGGVISLSESKVAPVKETENCETGWINTGLGFCVMQYEARNDGSNRPISTGTGLPWTDVSQIAAVAACKSIGAHLINNAEWMSLARDIESVGSNWTGGIVGSGVLKRGNVGDTEVGDYDAMGPEEGVSNALGTLTLSNGAQIHHLSGNVWELIDYNLSGTGAFPQSPSQSSWAWRDINEVTDWGSILGYINVGPQINL